MKYAIGAVLFCSGVAQAKNFMPENDLWRQDCLECESISPVNQEVFNKIIDAGKKAYASNAKNNDESIVINALWTDSTVNANCSRVGNKVTVNMYGGLARRQEMNAEGFALVLCHELGGHAYGGYPYVQFWNKMSAEGQSDYMATKECFAKIAALVPELKTTHDSYNEFSQNKCSKVFGNSSKYYNCINGAEGALSLGSLLAVLNKEAIPKFETPDSTVVQETELSYPATTQCRLDTYWNGLLNLSRPACWFKD